MSLLGTYIDHNGTLHYSYGTFDISSFKNVAQISSLVIQPLQEEYTRKSKVTWTEFCSTPRYPLSRILRLSSRLWTVRSTA